MGCIVLLFAFFSPRLAILATWLFSDALSGAFNGAIVPVLGFFLLPWTTLAYAWMWHSGGHVEGLEWFLVVFAFLVDVGIVGGGARSRR
jgi:hypothetical protein